MVNKFCNFYLFNKNIDILIIFQIKYKKKLNLLIPPSLSYGIKINFFS